MQKRHNSQASLIVSWNSTWQFLPSLQVTGLVGKGLHLISCCALSKADKRRNARTGNLARIVLARVIFSHLFPRTHMEKNWTSWTLYALSTRKRTCGHRPTPLSKRGASRVELVFVCESCSSTIDKILVDVNVHIEKRSCGFAKPVEGSAHKHKTLLTSLATSLAKWGAARFNIAN